MVSAINQNEDSIQMMMAQLYSKMNAADTDGTAGLSKDELSSVNAGGDDLSNMFLKSLTSQYDKLDEDKDGQLNASEISKALPQEPQLGPPPGMNLDGSDDVVSQMAEKFLQNKSDNSIKDSVKDLASSFVQKLIDSYKNGGLSDLTSNLSSIV